LFELAAIFLPPFGLTRLIFMAPEAAATVMPSFDTAITSPGLPDPSATSSAS
jgi:hypothetical protein